MRGRSLGAKTITVILPTYQRPALLERAIASVQRQAHEDVIIAVYDNASGDGTAEIVSRLAASDSRIQYHQHATNVGAALNFQAGLREVRTPFFAFLSDDDVVLPECYEAAMRGFGEHPEAMLSATRVVNKDETGALNESYARWRPGLHRPPEGLLTMLRDGLPIWTGSVWRSEVRDRIGLLDMEIPGALDTDYELRLAAELPYVLRHEVGAIFSSRSVETVKSLRPFSFAWPNSFRTVEKLRRTQTLPPAVREEAARLLESGLSRGVFTSGLQYVYHARDEDARSAYALLRSKHGNGKRNLLLAAALGLSRLPGGRATFCSIVRARKAVLSRWRARRIQRDAKGREGALPPKR